MRSAAFVLLLAAATRAQPWGVELFTAIDCTPTAGRVFNVQGPETCFNLTQKTCDSTVNGKACLFPEKIFGANITVYASFQLSYANPPPITLLSFNMWASKSASAGADGCSGAPLSSGSPVDGRVLPTTCSEGAPLFGATFSQANRKNEGATAPAYYYSAPPCLESELEMSVPNVAGSFCAPRADAARWPINFGCPDAADGAAMPPGAQDTGAAVIDANGSYDPSGNAPYCALLCKTDSGVQCGTAPDVSCQAVPDGVLNDGICTWGAR